MISVQCPSCKKVHSSPESMLGKKVRCNDCQHVFVVTHDTGLVDVTPTTNLPPHLRQEPAAANSSPKMIRHKCPRCKSKLESGAHLSGRSDVCPICKFTVAVPLLRKPNWLLRIALVAGVVVIGAAAFVILSHGWVALKLPVSASSATNQLTDTGAGKGLGSGNWGSPYSVDYKITAQGNWASVTATVNGPAAKLAVIFTDPNGKSDARIIAKDEMISNSHAVQLLMDDPQAGTYFLTVKTVDPEKVVWQKELTFSLSQLTIKDVKFDFKPNNWMGQFHGYQLSNIQITLQKTGNLPIRVTNASFTLDGSEFGGSIMEGIIVDQEDTLNIPIFHCPPTKKQIDENNSERSRGGFAPLPPIEAMFDPGERHLVKGKLFYGKDNVSLDFEKEFVTPENSEEGTGVQSTNHRRRISAPILSAPSSDVVTPQPEEPSVSAPELIKPMPPKKDTTAAEESVIKHEDEPTVFVSSRSGFNFKIIEVKRGYNGRDLKFTMLIRSQNKAQLMKLVEPKETAYIVDPNGNKYLFVSAGGTLWTGSEREENKVPERGHRGIPREMSRRSVVQDMGRQRRESNPTPSYQKFLADVDIKCYMTFLAPPPTVKKINLVFTFAYDDGSGWWFGSNSDDALFKDLNLETLILDVPQDANKSGNK